jgi:hypothetical protein
MTSHCKIGQTNRHCSNVLLSKGVKKVMTKKCQAKFDNMVVNNKFVIFSFFCPLLESSEFDNFNLL